MTFPEKPVRTHPKADRTNKDGFTIIELLIGFMVFTLLALGLTATALFNYRHAHFNIMKNTAYATAQGFLEQIKSIPESSLSAAIADPTGTPVPTRSVSASSGGGITHVDSPLYLSDPSKTSRGENYRKILIDLREESNGTFTDVYMDMWFDLDITRLASANGYAISIEFQYENPALKAITPQTETVRIIRTSGTSNP